MENYGFFDAELLLDGTYDREYVAQQWADYFKLFVGNGVFANPVNQLKVLSTSGMGIKVLPGWAFLNGYWYHNDLDLDITIPPNTTAQDQTHGIFVQFNSSTRTINVILGENRTSVNREAPIWELKLANVTVPAGSTSISDANITDTRGVTAVCGFVTGLIDVIDTTDLFAQYQQIFENWYTQIQLEQAQKSHAFDVWMQTEETDFDTWFDAMKGQLSTDAAGHLQAEIDAIMRGGSWLHLTTIELSLYGEAVTVTVGGETYTGSFDAHGVCDIFGVREIGNATITSTDGFRTATSYIEISSYNKYTAMVAFWAATVNLSTTSTELYGITIAVYRDGAFVGNTSFNMGGQCAYIATAPGIYKFICTYLGEEYDASVTVTAETTYSAVINVWTATINIVTNSSELYGATITIKDSNNNVVGTTAFDNTGNAVFKTHEPDTYTLSCEYSGETYFDTVEVTAETIYTATIDTIPDGSTVLPTDDIQTWLACAGIMNKSYTTLDEVLADHDTLARLISDNNAVDYMVRSKTWITGITEDETAMRYIGKRNYAADTLLDDSDWCEGICNSGYFEEVLNVKVPIGATAISNSESTAYPASTIFDGALQNSWGWRPNRAQPMGTCYAGYDFGTPICIKKVYTNIEAENNYSGKYNIQGSNDLSTWDDVSGQLDSHTGKYYSGNYACYDNNAVLNNTNSYRYYAIFPLTLYDGSTNSDAWSVHEVQFYGREDVVETGIDIYSAANDTVYYMENGSPVTVCTTDSTGYGTAAKALLPAGTYTLYSSVAKDPNNMSNDYSKQFVVTAGTIELRLIPDNALLWYGNVGPLGTMDASFITNQYGGSPYVNEVVENDAYKLSISETSSGFGGFTKQLSKNIIDFSTISAIKVLCSVVIPNAGEYFCLPLTESPITSLSYKNTAGGAPITVPSSVLAPQLTGGNVLQSIDVTSLTQQLYLNAGIWINTSGNIAIKAIYVE